MGSSDSHTLRFVSALTKPRDHKATYLNHVSSEKVTNPRPVPDKRVRTTAGGDRVEYSDETAVYTAGLKTVKLKLLWNVALSDFCSKFMTIDLKDFYLAPRSSPRNTLGYPYSKSAQSKYHTADLVVNGRVPVEITGGI